MRLVDYAKQQGIHYRTALRWFHSGKLKGRQFDTDTILIDDPETDVVVPQKVAVYVRVSSSENKTNLDAQAERLVNYCIAKGWQVSQVVKEIGSGVNDNRPKFLELLADTSITTIVVEHKDRATRFGFHYISTLLTSQKRHIEVVNLADNPSASSGYDGKEDLMQDLVSIVYSFSARMYGQRRAKRKTEIITKALEDTSDGS